MPKQFNSFQTTFQISSKNMPRRPTRYSRPHVQMKVAVLKREQIQTITSTFFLCGKSHGVRAPGPQGPQRPRRPQGSQGPQGPQRAPIVRGVRGNYRKTIRFFFFLGPLPWGQGPRGPKGPSWGPFHIKKKSSYILVHKCRL